MKLNYLIFTSLTCLLMSCGSSNKSAMKDGQEMPKIPSMITGEVTKSIVIGQDSSLCKVTYAFYAKPELPWQDSVNYAIGKFLWTSSSFSENPYVYQPLTHAYFQERLDSFERNHRIFERDSEYPMLWEIEVNSSIDDSLKNFAQVQQSCYIFTGGAHPNSFDINTLVSKQDGKTMRLKDMVSNVGEFNRIAEKYFREAREIGPEVSLAEEFWFEDSVFACNDNFYITAEGFHFTFNPYEISAYAYGSTEFTVPMGEIKRLLKVKLD